MANLSTLTSEVDRNSVLVDKVVAFLASAPTDQVAVDALAAKLKASNDKLDTSVPGMVPSPPL